MSVRSLLTWHSTRTSVGRIESNNESSGHIMGMEFYNFLRSYWFLKKACFIKLS